MEKLKISLLYVEDDGSLRNIYQHVFSSVLESVYVASNGLEGYDSYLENKPDIVLTDVRMPVMNGLDMIRKIRKRDTDVRIIILSAFGEPRYYLSAIEVGVSGYLLKPVETTVLLNMIKEQAYNILLDKKVKVEEEKRWKAEKAKAKNEAILQSVAEGTAIFFRKGLNPKTIAKVLKGLGEATGASRVYIFQNFEEKGKKYTSQTYEWVKNGIQAELGNPDLMRIDFNDSVVERWVSIMIKRGSIHGLIRDFPLGKEREVLEAQGIISILVIPLFLEDKWWGFIGLDDCETEREWSEGERKAVETLANNLEAALYRRQVEREILELNAHLEQRVADRTEALVKEISERRLTEVRLKESEEKYRLIYENANNGILLIIDGKVIMINPKTVEILQYKPSNLIGNPFIELVNDEDNSLFENFLKHRLSDESSESLDVRVLSGSGKVIWLEVKTNEIMWDDYPATLMFISDISARKKAEDELYQLNSELEGRIIEEVEKVKQQQQLLVQKSKLESIGELSAGLSHEINQPLGGISMGLDNILIRMEEQGIDQQYINEKFSILFQDIQRINQIIQHVRIFSRDQQIALNECVNVVEVIENALSMIRMEFTDHQVHLSIELPDESVEIFGNQYRLEQVILNLLSNSRFAVEEKEKQNLLSNYVKKIDVRCKKLNNHCVLEVRDNGTGISSKYLNNIFDPFFTTKDEDKGTGLGLSISYGIVKELGGQIRVESEEGEYSNFIINLPLKN